ncbi:isochorismatase [Nocardia sputorum]|uniref:cysteine hydrolase family protein n=1 Tax=Nocardia sputorum TaxID=2984338 RepID=UPI00249099A6|nr:isochorismatase family cysteine hydrolase [Nocardia sputorum]BDT92461.1 isochorismatase [Nocardia sputorum]
MVIWNIVPERTALLLLDLQNLFVSGPLAVRDALALINRLNILTKACRAHRIPIIATSHTLRPDGANSGRLVDILPPGGTRLVAQGSAAAALHSKLQLEPGDIVLAKPRFGAFAGTDLDLILRARDIDTVIIGGIATNVCCETTAREAATRDYRVVFLSDGTSCAEMPDLGWGAVSADDITRVTLSTLSMAFAEVTTCADVAARIAMRRPRL